MKKQKKPWIEWAMTVTLKYLREQGGIATIVGIADVLIKQHASDRVRLRQARIDGFLRTRDRGNHYALTVATRLEREGTVTAHRDYTGRISTIVLATGFQNGR